MEEIDPREALTLWRKSNNLSYAEAAGKVGVSATTFFDWEHHNRRPDEPYREILEVLTGIPRGAWRNEKERKLVANQLAALREQGIPAPPVGAEPTASDFTGPVQHAAGT